VGTSLVVIGARNQNQAAIQASEKLAETALAVKRREISRNIKDYVERADFRQRFDGSIDTAWAAEDGNLGSNIFASLGYEMALVLSTEGNLRYAVVEGKPVPLDVLKALPDGLKEFVVTAATRSMPEVGLLQSGADILLVAAARLHDRASDDVQTSDPQVLVFTKKLNGPLLTRIGSDYLLNRFRLRASDDADLGASLPLRSPKGDTIGYVTWIPERPGDDHMRFVLPPMGASFVVFTILAGMTYRYSRRANARLKASAITIDGYAETLQQSEARFRDVAEASSDWIWECDRDLRLVFVSSRFEEVTGLNDKAAIGQPLDTFFRVDPALAGWLRPSGEPSEDVIRDLRYSYEDAEGRTRVGRVSARAIWSENGGWSGYRGTATDITAEVEAHARAEHLSLHDTLTGLPNRSLFRAKLDRAIDRHRMGEAALAVLCLDLDHFKDVNDTYGHAAGDLLLEEVSARLLSCVRDDDTVARLGGDEFAVVQLGIAQPFDAITLSRRILEALSAPYEVSGREHVLGVSIGICAPDGDQAADLVLRNADIALYDAKQSGRGAARVYEAHMGLDREVRLGLEQDLKRALELAQFELHYQPLVALRDESILGVEALVRWHHPIRGLVAPGDFIPLAEETGLIVALGEWVLRTACAQATRWPEIVIAVNLSPVQFAQRDIVAMVDQVLRDTGLEPTRLELEITEGVLMRDGVAARDTLNRLKALGVRIAMDDFGTGYSSLGTLNSFPFDKIKIDRSFIADLSAQKSNAIVRSVIGLGQSLDMKITAEGVETEEQAAFLRREGCEQVQGYLFGRPMSAMDMDRTMKDFARRNETKAA
jgi:diguanylate cyclase (GGDEF)-like protein/PAS domain S-box-containing protein